MEGQVCLRIAMRLATRDVRHAAMTKSVHTRTAIKGAAHRIGTGTGIQMN